MKTISLSVSEKDYEAFRAEAKREQRSIASLIREAMAMHLQRRLRVVEGGGGAPAPPTDLPTAVIQEVATRPGRYEIYAEVREVE